MDCLVRCYRYFNGWMLECETFDKPCVRETEWVPFALAQKMDKGEHDTVVNALIARSMAKRDQAKAGKEAVDPEWAKKYPALHAYMTSVEGEKAEVPRKTATLLLFAQNGAFSACLTDKETNTVLWGNGSSLGGIFTQLEKLLQSDEPPWKPGWEPRGKKR